MGFRVYTGRQEIEKGPAKFRATWDDERKKTFARCSSFSSCDISAARREIAKPFSVSNAHLPICLRKGLRFAICVSAVASVRF